MRWTEIIAWNDFFAYKSVKTSLKLIKFDSNIFLLLFLKKQVNYGKKSQVKSSKNQSHDFLVSCLDFFLKKWVAAQKSLEKSL